MKPVITLLSLLGIAAAASAQPRIGWPAPDFAAKDISGKTVSLAQFKGKIVVLEAYKNIGCPFCEAHYKTGAMPELQMELTNKGVVWLLVDFEPRVVEQTPAKAKQIWADQKMAITDFIIDTDGSQIGRRYLLKAAPEAVVIDQGGRLAYEGAFDDFNKLCWDSPSFLATVEGRGTAVGRMPIQQLLAARDNAIINLDPRPAHNYLRAVVSALLAGKPSPMNGSPLYGCPLHIYSN